MVSIAVRMITNTRAPLKAIGTIRRQRIGAVCLVDLCIFCYLCNQSGVSLNHPEHVSHEITRNSSLWWKKSGTSTIYVVDSNERNRALHKELILVVDDDPQITSFLKRYLGKQGFDVRCASDATEMQTLLERNNVDLCILDIGLPGKNGLEITRDIRHKSSLPILVLSGNDEPLDRVMGLEFGADDYMIKPYEPRELLARIRSILRRCKTGGSTVENNHPLHVFGNWQVNYVERSLTRVTTGEAVPLTTTEFELLYQFVSNPGTVFSRNQLLDSARGRESFSGDRAIDVHIMRLRSKLAVDEPEQGYIKTIHGVGYSFVAKVSKQ